MKKYFALIFICLIILASTAASSFCAPCNPALIPAEADFAIQISFCETHKKTLNQIVTKIFDDKNAGREVPDLIDIFGDEFGKFFLKASFETILKDLEIVTFFGYPANEKTDSPKAILFTFKNEERSKMLFELRKDLLEGLLYDELKSGEIKLGEEKFGEIQCTTAKIKNVKTGTAFLSYKNHVGILHSAGQDEIFKKLSDSIAKAVQKYEKNEANPAFAKEMMHFSKDNNLFATFKIGNLETSDSSDVSIIKSISAAAKIEEDFSKVSFDSLISMLNLEKEKWPSEYKVIEALKLILSGGAKKINAIASLPEDVSYLIDFSLNFNEKFLAITDVFVFRGILLTATGIDYKDDFLSWFDGEIFSGLGKLDFNVREAFEKKQLDAPEAYIGFKSKDTSLAAKFIDKLLKCFEDNAMALKIETATISGIKAQCLKISLPYVKNLEICLGQAGDYCIVTSNKKAFEKFAASSSKKAPTLAMVNHFKNYANFSEGAFFNFYINYQSLLETINKIGEVKPEYNFFSCLTLDSYSAGIKIADNDLLANAILVINKKKFDEFVSSVNVKKIKELFKMLEKLSE